MTAACIDDQEGQPGLQACWALTGTRLQRTDNAYCIIRPISEDLADGFSVFGLVR